VVVSRCTREGTEGEIVLAIFGAGTTLATGCKALGGKEGKPPLKNFTAPVR